MLNKMTVTIQEKLDKDYYTSTLPQPDAALCPKRPINTIHGDASTSQEIIDYGIKLKQYESDCILWKELWNPLEEDQGKLYAEFKDDIYEMFVEAGATIKQAQKATYLAYAYDKGHSGGVNDMFNEAVSLLSIWDD